MKITKFAIVRLNYKNRAQNHVLIYVLFEYSCNSAFACNHALTLKIMYLDLGVCCRLYSAVLIVFRHAWASIKQAMLLRSIGFSIASFNMSWSMPRENEYFLRDKINCQCNDKNIRDKAVRNMPLFYKSMYKSLRDCQVGLTMIIKSLNIWFVTIVKEQHRMEEDSNCAVTSWPIFIRFHKIFTCPLSRILTFALGRLRYLMGIDPHSRTSRELSLICRKCTSSRCLNTRALFHCVSNP